ncbi:hypothetical protein EV382_2760 [Micromonospora violae]|uniref:Uncharacterized protein n=1 Tax=Micromonospora violae TaxID=1278207 RepID=A0A4Q7UEJ0_9ACTN|nr:hypothetical protein [Micromonospora violae]RZT79546.1 hypothetical protein EV382_2760 [Micromonospora violae]
MEITNKKGALDTLRWSGLTPGRLYVGVLALSNGKEPLKTLPITVRS